MMPRRRKYDLTAYSTIVRSAVAASQCGDSTKGTHPSCGLTSLRGAGDQYLFVREAKISLVGDRVCLLHGHTEVRLLMGLSSQWQMQILHSPSSVTISNGLIDGFYQRAESDEDSVIRAFERLRKFRKGETAECIGI